MLRTMLHSLRTEDSVMGLQAQLSYSQFSIDIYSFRIWVYLVIIAINIYMLILTNSLTHFDKIEYFRILYLVSKLDKAAVYESDKI